jgi:hypothetical protein
MERKLPVLPGLLLDSALIIGGKCAYPAVPVKSPGQNQFALGVKARLLVSSQAGETF